MSRKSNETTALIDVETVNAQSLLTCLEYLGREASTAGYILTAHLIEAAAESLSGEGLAEEQENNVVPLPM